MGISNGGVSQLARVSLIPMRDINSGNEALYAFDPLSGFNDPVNPSNYAFRVEDIITGRTATISRLIISYRDLGVVKVRFTLAGTVTVNGEGKLLSKSIDVKLGNKLATNKIITTFLEPVLTAQNLQLIISRAANAGPLSITKVVMCGRVEMQEYA